MAQEPAPPTLPPAALGQVQRPQQPSARSLRRRMTPSCRSSLGPQRLSGGSAGGRSGPPVPPGKATGLGTQGRGGKCAGHSLGPSDLPTVGTKPLDPFYTSAPCRWESRCTGLRLPPPRTGEQVCGHYGPGAGPVVGITGSMPFLTEYFRKKRPFPHMV